MERTKYCGETNWLQGVQGCKNRNIKVVERPTQDFFAQAFSLRTFIIDHKVCHDVNLLFHFLGAEVQVAITDPLDLEPVLEVIVPTALELHLQPINVLLLEAATRGVCVLVEADAVPQASFQRRLQTACHCIAHNDSQQHEGGEKARCGKIGLQEVLPARKAASIQSILTDL